MNYTANALLAMGASPVMAHALGEVEEMVSFAGALVLNIGTLTDINVLTEEGVQAAIEITDVTLSQLDSTRADLGASQNQLTSTVANLSTTSINIQAAESQIGDVDFAEESIMLNKMKILNQAQTFAAAQTGKINQQQMMSLLQG